MKGVPLITTIIPTYDRPALLRRAIASALAQTVRDIQVRVYDNAGHPDNQAVVGSFADSRLRYQRHPTNLGQLANYQYGLSQVDTPFFSILADDDVLLPDFYASAVEALRAVPEAMFAATRVVIADSAGRTLAIDGLGWPAGGYRPPDGLQAMVRFGHINWAGILFRRQVLQVVPWLDPQTAPSFDLDFELRLAGRCPFVVCAQTGALLIHQRDSISAANRLDDTWPAFLKIIDNAVADEKIPTPTRDQLRAALEEQLAGRIFRLGRAAARHGRVDDADRAAAVIAERYGWSVRAQLLRSSARVCAALPPARAALALVLEGYRAAHSLRLRAAFPDDYAALVRAGKYVTHPLQPAA